MPGKTWIKGGSCELEFEQTHDGCTTTVKHKADKARWVEIEYKRGEHDQPVKFHFEVHDHEDRYARISWSYKEPND